MIPLIIFLLCTLTSLLLWYFTFVSRRFSRPIDVEAEIAALNLPKTGAERRAAMNADPEMFRKIQRAAKLKVGDSQRRDFSAVLRRAGYYTAEAQRAFGLAVLVGIIAGGVAGALLALLIHGTIGAALIGAAIGNLAGPSIPLQYVHLRAFGNELQLLEELPHLIEQLISALQAARDIPTALNQIVRTAELGGAAYSTSFLREALNRASHAYPLETALRDQAALSGHRQLGTVIGILFQSERYGTERSTQLRALAAEVRAAHSVRQRLPLARLASSLAGRAEFTPSGVGASLEQQTQSAALEFAQYLQHLRRLLNQGLQLLPALIKAAEHLPPDSYLAGEITLLQQNIRNGLSEEEALQLFGRELTLPAFQHFRRALLLSQTEHAALAPALDEILRDLA